MFIKKLKKYFLNFLEFLRSLIFPKTCLICNEIIANGHFCAQDFNKLRFISNPKCKICGDPFEFEVNEGALCGSCLTKRPKYDKAISVLDYNDVSKDFILALKYKDKTHYSEFFAKILFDASKSIIEQIDFVSAIPLHKKRLKKRKFNHSILIAKDFCKITKLPLIYDLIIRQKDTKPQFILNKSQRKRNISGAFKFNDRYLNEIMGKNILIIDDVITTGVTIDEYCKILRKHKVDKIFILTLAKAII